MRYAILQVHLLGRWCFTGVPELYSPGFQYWVLKSLSNMVLPWLHLHWQFPTKGKTRVHKCIFKKSVAVLEMYGGGDEFFSFKYSACDTLPKSRCFSLTCTFKTSSPPFITSANLGGKKEAKTNQSIPEISGPNNQNQMKPPRPVFSIKSYNNWKRKSFKRVWKTYKGNNLL